MMNLPDILFARKLAGNSGGSAVDDGYCLQWDGDRTGLEVIDASDLGFGMFYKVSDTILSAEKLTGAYGTVSAGGVAHYENMSVTGDNIVSVTGCTLVVMENTPFVISGVVGNHTINSLVTVPIPSDGTYFSWGEGDFTMYVDLLCKDTTL